MHKHDCCEYEVYGWIIWDKDDPKGFDESLFIYGKNNPVKPEDEQREYGGDHQGHIWDSFPLYRLVGSVDEP
jgi:hypothetical protein